MKIYGFCRARYFNRYLRFLVLFTTQNDMIDSPNDKTESDVGIQLKISFFSCLQTFREENCSPNSHHHSIENMCRNSKTFYFYRHVKMKVFEWVVATLNVQRSLTNRFQQGHMILYRGSGKMMSALNAFSRLIKLYKYY